MISFLPSNIKILILKKNKQTIVFFYSLNKIFLIQFKNYRIYYNPFLKTLKLLNINLYNLNITNFIFNWDLFFFKKVIFSGKGYKTKLNKNSSILNINISHPFCLFLKKTLFLKISKNKFILYFKNFMIFSKLYNRFNYTRTFNSYIKGGIRLSRQITKKRKNKGIVT